MWVKLLLCLALVCLAVAPAPPAKPVAAAAKIPVATPTQKLPDLDLAKEMAKSTGDIQWFGNLFKIPSMWWYTGSEGYGKDTGLLGRRPAQSDPPKDKNLGEYNYLLAYLSAGIYNGDVKEGEFFSVPFKTGCTTLQVYKKINGGAVTIYNWPAQKSAVLIFRGTASFSDALADLKTGQGPLQRHVYGGSVGVSNLEGVLVHKGFESRYASYQNDIWEGLKSFRKDMDYHESVFVGGHSLGCALATLFALDTKLGKNQHFYNYHVMGLGCPGTGNKAFIDKFLSGPDYFQRFTSNDDTAAKLLAEIRSATKPAVRKQALLEAGAVSSDSATPAAATSDSEKGDDVFTTYNPENLKFGPNIRLKCSQGGQCGSAMALHNVNNYVKMLQKYYDLPTRSSHCHKWHEGGAFGGQGYFPAEARVRLDVSLRMDV